MHQAATDLVAVELDSRSSPLVGIRHRLASSVCASVATRFLERIILSLIALELKR